MNKPREMYFGASGSVWRRVVRRIATLASVVVLTLLLLDWTAGKLIAWRTMRFGSGKQEMRIYPAAYVMTEVRQITGIANPEAHVNNQGFRHFQDLGMTKTRPRVFILGGSFAFGTGASNDSTYYLARIMKRFPEIEFVCAASGGYVANQEWIQLGLNVFPFHPDGVIIIDGANDLNFPLMFGQEPGFPWKWEESRGFMIGRPLPFLVSFIKTRSNIYRFIQRLRQNRNCQNPQFEEQIYPLIEQRYLHATRLTYDLCRARGIPVWHVFQPQLALFKSPSDQERPFLIEALASADRRLYLKMLSAAQANAASNDVPFLDLTRCFENDTRTVYCDYCHLNDVGQAVVGEQIGAFLNNTSLQDKVVKR